MAVKAEQGLSAFKGALPRALEKLAGRAARSEAQPLPGTTSPTEALATKSVAAELAPSTAAAAPSTHLAQTGFERGENRAEAANRLGAPEAVTTPYPTSASRSLGWESRAPETGGVRVSSDRLPQQFLGTKPEGMDPDGVVQTLKGQANLYLESLRPPPGNQQVLIEHKAFDKPVPVTLNLRRDAQGKLLKAPLVTVFVGIHGNGWADRFDRFIIRMLSSLGNHVLVLPNSFSDNYTQAQPHFPATSMLAESRISYDLMHAVTEQGHLPKDAVTETRVLGYSYGAVMASILASESLKYDRETGRPRTLDGDVTIVAPLLHLRNGQRQLDNFIQSYEDSSYTDLLNGYLGMLGATEMTAQGARAVIGGVFEGQLTQTLMNMKPVAHRLRNPNVPNAQPGDLVENFQQVPNSAWFDPRYSDFKSKVRYEEKMGEVTYSDSFYDGRTTHLALWLLRNKKLGGPPISFIAAKDDPLNVLDRWQYEDPRFPLKEADGNLLLIEHGGHGGFLATPWFKDLMATRFGVKKAEGEAPR